MPEAGDDTQRPTTGTRTQARALDQALSQARQARIADLVPAQDQAPVEPGTPVRSDPGRRRRRETFLADLDEAQRLLERVAPRRTRLAQLRQQQLMRTYLH